MIIVKLRQQLKKIKFNPLKKIQFLLLSAAGLALSLTSCVNDEYLPNSEADILEATIDGAGTLLSTEPDVLDNKIIFRLKELPDSYFFGPKFKLTDGAEISPESGAVRDFTEPQTYVVTSEDGLWQKEYVVEFLVDSPNFLYSFEAVEEDPNNHYHTFYSYNEEGQKVYKWDSGNNGFSLTLFLTGQEQKPDAYPTYQIENGYEGNGVKLVTLSTGSLGASFGAPLAAGNLFIGKLFEINPSDPRLGLHFGKRFKSPTAPVRLEGFYKYKAGEEFTVTNPPSALTKDTWDAYAVLFEKSENEPYLLGDFSFDDPRIIGVARVDSQIYGETDEWTAFDAPFVFKEGKHFNPTEDYMYTIVFSASKEGNIFNGAVGSTLIIDEVKLITE